MSDRDDMLSGWAQEMGVPVEVLASWTRDDWQRHLDRLDRHQIAFTAAVDRDEAACAEASRCGCPIEAEVYDDGSPVIGTASVVHSCDRAT